MPRRMADNLNEPASAVEYPLLTAVGEWAHFKGSGEIDPEAELTRIMDFMAVQHGGIGYLSHLRAGREPESGRER